MFKIIDGILQKAAIKRRVEFATTMRMRKKPNIAARMEKCAHLLATEPEKLRGRWLDGFGFCELQIELGCGKGRFTVETAKSAPETLIVALEKSADAMIIAIERAVNEELRNLRFINGFADDIIDYFSPGEAARIYLNFCDPWPANRHAKRRLTGRRFLELYRQVLRPGGEIYFKTDDLPLFEFSLREFESCGFETIEVARDLHKNGPAGVMSDYELKFYDQGTAIYHGIFKS